jgi:hypothetical protein
MRRRQGRRAVAVVALLRLIGCATTSSRESPGEWSEDAAMTAKVKSSFAADPIGGDLDTPAGLPGSLYGQTSTEPIVRRPLACADKPACDEKIPVMVHPNFQRSVVQRAGLNLPKVAPRAFLWLSRGRPYPLPQRG